MELNEVLEEKNGAKIPRFRSPKLVAAAERVKTEYRWERLGGERRVIGYFKR